MSSKDKKEKDLKEENEKQIEENEEQEKSLLDENLKQKESEVAELSGQLIRLQADFVNFRKRAEKERKDTISYALEEFICALLPVIDNFEIAMEADDKEDSFYKGIELIHKQLKSVLESNGVKAIESLGKEFDPNIHHAVFMEESEDYDSGKVTEVLQQGYMLKDKLIRPATVKVAK
jgi:molecular chaperone GrpE